jgi:hypothetical protein
LASSPGSASLELIEEVLVDANDGALDLWAVVDALDLLVDRSLVALLASDGRRRARATVSSETPRAYALECLATAASSRSCSAVMRSPWRRCSTAAYEEYFSGRVGVDEWLRRRSRPTSTTARDALRWARGAGDAAVELRIGAPLLRALPPSLHVERMVLADACELRIGPAVPEALQLRAWIELSCVLADSQKARARHAAEAALGLARRLDAFQTDRFVLYHALCRAASSAAQADDLAAARALLDEVGRCEDPAWPAQRLIWATEAAQWFARMSGDADAALQRGRRLLPWTASAAATRRSPSAT